MSASQIGRLSRLMRLSLLSLLPLCAHADPEIMVHEDDLSEVGEVAVTLHTNHAQKGHREGENGVWPARRLTNAMLELATGLAPGWEAGIHLPAMRAGVDGPGFRAGSWGSSAVMFRLKHVQMLENGFFVGFNTEYDLNARRYVSDARSIEMRGIVGWEGEQWKFIANPHYIWGYTGHDTRHIPDFNVDAKALYKASADLAFGAEIYSDWGRADRVRPGEGDRTLYLVTEMAQGTDSSLHLGIGHGFKDTPERLILKAVWSTSFR